MRQRHPAEWSPAIEGPAAAPLKVFLEQTDVTWASAEVAWYDGITRAVSNYLPDGGLVPPGKPPVLIRWVLIRPPGLLRHSGPACYRPGGPDPTFRSWNGSHCAGNWRSPSTRSEPIYCGDTTPRRRITNWDLQEDQAGKRHPMTQRKAAWYDKPSPTFVDAMPASPPVAGVGRFLLRRLTPTFRTLSTGRTVPPIVDSLATPLELRKALASATVHRIDTQQVTTPSCPSDD